MIFNEHSEIKNEHAFLGASNFQWLSYDKDKLKARYSNRLATSMGTKLHEFGACHINTFKKLPKSKKTLMVAFESFLMGKESSPEFINEAQNISSESLISLAEHVNDAIGFGMNAEQPLKYSSISFGTADAISFNERENKLRIHDYKSGVIPGDMRQLLIYSALFCLEYMVDPVNIDIELRIYQSGEVEKYIPESHEVSDIMNRIVENVAILSEL